MANIFDYYNSLGEFVAHAAKTPTWASPSSRNTTDPKWAGTKDFEEAQGLALHGWKEGRKNMVEAVEAVARANSFTPSPSLQMDVAGAYPIAALAAAGDPACMVDLQPVEDRTRPILKILFNGAATSNYSAKEMTNYGAAFLSVVDRLEANGYRCEIDVVMPCKGFNGTMFCSRVNVKKAEEPFELDRMAFALSHPSMLRRLKFGVMEQRPEMEQEFRSTYGTTADLEEKDRDGWFYVPTIRTGFSSGSAAMKTPEAAYKAMVPYLQKVLTGLDVVAAMGEGRGAE